jgi:hypothetical protein
LDVSRAKIDPTIMGPSRSHSLHSKDSIATIRCAITRRVFCPTQLADNSSDNY